MHSFTWQRAVIKVGSTLVAPTGAQCSTRYLLPLARFISASREAGKEIIVVSSGSVAAGKHAVPLTRVPSIAEKQAMAAIGQNQMMAMWARFFDSPCAQVLLTAEDFANRTRFVNIQNTLRELLKHDAIPIVNENDTVATDELKVGDNDNLAALTALVAQADTLIMFSDIDGLYTADPNRDSRATRIDKVDNIDDNIYALAGGAGSVIGTGGMQTKIEAADKCAQSGIQSLIVNGRKAAVIDSLLAGQCPGTLFEPQFSAQNARTQWLKHTLRSKGKVVVDSGASVALISRKSSLLPKGVLEVSGHFDCGDCVEIWANGSVIAKGLALYNSHDMRLIKGLHSKQIQSVLGYNYGSTAIHKDDLVLLSN